MRRINGRVEPEERIDPVIRAEAQRRLRQRQGLPVEPEDGLVQDQIGGEGVGRGNQKNVVRIQKLKVRKVIIDSVNDS